MALEIIQILSSKMDNFSYLIFCPSTLKAIAVDPSYAAESLIDAARKKNLTIEILVNTHGHSDHMAGNRELLQATGAALAGHPADIPNADILLKDGDTLTVGNETVNILHTPGHSPGSLTLNPPGALITGDTLFITRVGRADLSGSDPEALYHSLQRLAGFPDETRVYPGHNYGPRPVSTIAFEKDKNPYLKCPDLESFIRLRMG